MKWYLAKIVFQVIVAGAEQPARFDEQLRLIAATSKEEAVSKAQQLGVSEEDTLVNVNNNLLIKWKFINLSMLYQLKELLDGAEIGSATHEPDCVDSYISMIHHKAALIRDSDTLELLQLV